MCERTYCRHEHERLCSCPPVTCRDALGMAAHLAENMEQVQWSLTYNSLKDIKPYQLCLVGKCRICGGRLCMEQRPLRRIALTVSLLRYTGIYTIFTAPSVSACLARRFAQSL